MDPQTAAFLQDTLRGYTPVVPALPTSPYAYLQQGMNVGNTIDNDLYQGATRGYQLQTDALNAQFLPQTKEAMAAELQAKTAQANAAAVQANAHAQYFLHRANPSAPVAAPTWDNSPTGGVGAVTAPAASSGDLQAVDPNFDVSGLPAADAFDIGTGAPSDDSDAAPILGASPFPNTAANGTYSGTGTVFAGPKDLNAYQTAKANGASENDALKVGDNGVGASGVKTATNDPMVALKPSFMQANGLKFGDPITVNANGAQVVARVQDHLPEDSASLVDMNPGASSALKVDPDNFKGQVSLQVGGKPALAAATPPASASDDLPVANADDSNYSTDQLMGQPMMAISGAFPGDPNYPVTGTPVPAPAPATAGAAFGSIPQNDQDVSDLQAKLARNIAVAQANPAYGQDRNSRAVIDSTIRQWNAEYNHAVQTYRINQQAAARTQAASQRAPLTDADQVQALQDRGFAPDSVEVKTANGTYRMKMGDPRGDAEQNVALATGGATVQDILNDRGNYQDNPNATADKPLAGKVTPDTHYFTRTDPKTGETSTQAIPEAIYQRLRAQVDPLVYGSGPGKGATMPGAPSYSTSDLPPMALALGSHALVPASSVPTPNYVPPTVAPVPTTQSKLATAAASVAPVTDAEKDAAPILADQQQKQAAVQAATVAKQQPLTRDAVMKLQTDNLNQHIQNLSGQLATNVNSYKTPDVDQDGQNRYLPPGMGNDDITRQSVSAVAQRLKEARARLAAASDPNNYKPGPNGSYYYDDPYGNTMTNGMASNKAGANSTFAPAHP
jgi:hypothetical protein